MIFLPVAFDFDAAFFFAPDFFFVEVFPFPEDFVFVEDFDFVDDFDFVADTFARTMFSADPALNHSTCSSLKVCFAWNSIMRPSAFVMRHFTGLSGTGGRFKTLMRSLSSMRSYVFGSANVNGTRPCFFKLVSWIRANERAKITTPPRKRGSIAACSRDEPSP